MAIVLTILKIIGITLLVLIGLLLAVICIVLFVPIRYAGEVYLHPSTQRTDRDEQWGRYGSNVQKTADPAGGSLCLSWLLHLVRFSGRFSRTEGWYVSVKILHITLLSKGSAARHEAGSAAVKVEKQPGSDSAGGGRAAQKRAAEGEGAVLDFDKDSAQSAGADICTQIDTKTDQDQSSIDQVHAAGQVSNEAYTAGKSETGAGRQTNDSTREADDTEVQRPGVRERLRRTVSGAASAIGSAAEHLRAGTEQAGGWLSTVPGRLSELLWRISDAVDEGTEAVIAGCEKFADRIERFARKAEPFLDDDARAWYGRVLRMLGRTLRHWWPRRMTGRIEIGTGSPDTTALLYGMIMKILPPGAKVDVENDLYEAGCEAEIKGKGHIRLWHIVWRMISLLFDPQTRVMIRRVLKVRRGD